MSMVLRAAYIYAEWAQIIKTFKEPIGWLVTIVRECAYFVRWMALKSTEWQEKKINWFIQSEITHGYRDFTMLRVLKSHGN